MSSVRVVRPVVRKYCYRASNRGWVIDIINGKRYPIDQVDPDDVYKTFMRAYLAAKDDGAVTGPDDCDRYEVWKLYRRINNQMKVLDRRC